MAICSGEITDKYWCERIPPKSSLKVPNFDKFAWAEKASMKKMDPSRKVFSRGIVKLSVVLVSEKNGLWLTDLLQSLEKKRRFEDATSLKNQRDGEKITSGTNLSICTLCTKLNSFKLLRVIVMFKMHCVENMQEELDEAVALT